MSTKIKTKVAAPLTDMQANEVLKRMAKADKEMATLNAKMDKDMAKIREKYNDQIVWYKEEIDECNAVIMGYAASHPDLFKEKKSYEMHYGVIGYRSSTSITLKEGVKEADIIEAMRDNQILQGYINAKTVYSIDKKALLKQKDNAALVKELKAANVSIEEHEIFYINLK